MSIGPRLPPNDAEAFDDTLLRRFVDNVEHYAIFGLSPNGYVVSWNSGAQTLFGYTTAEIRGRHFSIFFLADDAAADVPGHELRKALEGRFSNQERLLQRKDGTTFWATDFVQPIYDHSARLVGFSKLVHDVTQAHQLTARLNEHAMRDPLTNLVNRRYFHEHVARAIAFRTRHANSEFAVLFLDIDHFKRFNDTLGHVAADTVLVHVARTLENCVRPEDVVCRLAGDEFAILLTAVNSAAEAQDVASRVEFCLGKPFLCGDDAIHVSASIGIALSSSAYATPDDIIRDADRAMYAAKGGGRGQAVFFVESSMRDIYYERTVLTDLRQAIISNGLHLVYQPIIALPARSIVGWEALLRWDHPERGPIPPGDFIALAEATNTIIAVDRWVLRTACSQFAAARFTAAGTRAGLAKTYLSVNMSAKQFAQPDLTLFVRETLAETGIKATDVRLEITETSLLRRSSDVIRTLTELRALGVEIFADDFGTGQSPLLLLCDRQVDALKIDREFVSGPFGDDGFVVARMVVALAESFRIITVAEGVETFEQLERIDALGCRFAQGFVVSAPLRADDLPAFMIEYAAR